MTIKQDILALREQGKTYREISETLQCAKSTVSYHLSKVTRDSAKLRAKLKMEKTGRRGSRVGPILYCSSCSEHKTVDQFSPNNKGLLGLASQCKACKALKNQTWNVDNIHSKRAARYNLTKDQLIDLLKVGTCPLCGRTPEKGLVIDHCHTSLRVRGAICQSCNIALGAVQDRPEVLENMIQYLK